MRRKNTKLREYKLIGARINSAYISRELKRYFVVGDSLNNIHLYSLSEDDEIQTLSSSTGSVQAEVSAVALSLNEDEIYAGSNRGIINLWNVETGKSLTSLKGHATSVNCFTVFPGEPYKLASGSYDSNVKLWDLRSRENTGILKGHTQPVKTVDASPEGNYVLTGSEDNNIKLWDTRMGDRLLCNYSEHSAAVNQVRFNSNVCMFASCSMDRTARQFICEEKHYKHVASTDLVATPITAIEYGDDENFLFTAANDTLKLWNMNKNGLLLENIESSWKGVLDLTFVNNVLFGVASTPGNLNVWFCDLQLKKHSYINQNQESNLVFPKINRNVKNDSPEIAEILNNVNNAINLANNLEERKKEDISKRLPDLEKLREEENKIDEAEILRREKEKKEKEEKEKKQKEQKEHERQRKIEEEILLEKKLREERIQREIRLNENIKNTLQQPFEQTLVPESMNNSSFMNMSAFVVDGVQKEKLLQFELLGDIMKDKNTFEEILRNKANKLKPFLTYWKQGRIQLAIELLQATYEDRTQTYALVIDCLNSVLQNNTLKSAITPSIAVYFLQTLQKIMNTKHFKFVKMSMSTCNVIVNMFKNELIQVKTFNPLTRVDLAREERLAKYDKLLEEFLNVFHQERLKKYAFDRISAENEQLNLVSIELYKNLKEVLQKILPKNEPEPA